MATTKSSEDTHITHSEFFHYIETWRDGGRVCKIRMTQANGEVEIDNAAVTGFDEQSSQVFLKAGDSKPTLHLSWGDRFEYLDYNDRDPEMARYVDVGFPAWLRAYAGDKLLASLLLYED